MPEQNLHLFKYKSLIAEGNAVASQVMADLQIKGVLLKYQGCLNPLQPG